MWRDVDVELIWRHIRRRTARSALAGAWLLEERRRHAVVVRDGTRSPLRHRLEEVGLLAREACGASGRTGATATTRGRAPAGGGST